MGTWSVLSASGRQTTLDTPTNLGTDFKVTFRLKYTPARFGSFTELPKLRRLYLHELSGVSDIGLKHLGSLQSLELLDIWSVPMTDATIDMIAALPNLKELGIRTTDVTDAAIDKLLAMPKLQSLTFKENGTVTDVGLKKLSKKKWTKLDIGSSSNSGTE